VKRDGNGRTLHVRLPSCKNPGNTVSGFPLRSNPDYRPNSIADPGPG